jgi:hypothetical protein
VYDEYEACGCVCNKTCPAPYVLDSTKCQCVCDKKCSEGYVLTQDCQCVEPSCRTAKNAQECYASKCESDRTKSCE